MAETDIIEQNGIVKVLEQRGFVKNQDFMFVGMNEETDLMFDGVPMYRIANYPHNETGFYSEKLKRNLTLKVISDYNMKPGFKQTSSNNSVYAVYVRGQGFVFTVDDPAIKQLMEKEFGFKDTHFGIPLSNGAAFRDEKKQNIWKKVQLYVATKQLQKEIENKPLNPDLINKIGERDK